MNDEVLGYKFKDVTLLKQALTHPSLCLKNQGLLSYERMELLGDSVLNLIIVDELLKKYPNEDEGKIAKRKSALVAGDAIARIALKYGIGELLQMSVSEEKSGGRKNPHSLENAMEAIIAAIFLDSDFATAREIVLKMWQESINNMIEIPIDAKSKLQEELQKRGLNLPTYQVVEKSGPDHMLSFKVKLSIEGFESSFGEGSSKQAAEKQAALKFLKNFTN